VPRHIFLAHCFKHVTSRFVSQVQIANCAKNSSASRPHSNLRNARDTIRNRKPAPASIRIANHPRSNAMPSQQSAKKHPNRRGSNSPPSTLTLIDGIHPQMLQKYCSCICTTGIRRQLFQKSANGNANGPVSNWPATKNTAADSHRPNSGQCSKHHRGFAQ
jgi:hypothetical protein